jgi:hypothetical protein
MNFLKKLFNLSSQEEPVVENQPVNLSMDDLFVHNFLKKEGKFLYCAKIFEVIENLKNILSENNWNELLLLNKNLENFLTEEVAKITTKFSDETPIFTTCEHLIADNGDILFSSNQIGSKRLADFPKNFIVYATTSQIVKNSGQGLTGIKMNHKLNLPTNISAIKNYNINIVDDNFLNYGNNNSKNLYLLLLEDL